jgi:hypothetical protein
MSRSIITRFTCPFFSMYFFFMALRAKSSPLSFLRTRITLA